MPRNPKVDRSLSNTMQRGRGGLREALVPAFAVILATAACRQDRPEPITVVSWGGSYGRAVEEATIVPFTEATGIPVNLGAYNGGLAEIRAQVDIGNVQWDVVSLEIADAVQACDEGLLEPIDIDALPPGYDGTPAAEDFVAETQTVCGAPFLYASTVI
ncbi:MAG: extracellular solute-binding protein, partial [Gammaproteobacteria bacterium]|nr:extracellular solute-binding protein [Gammaproteobacteria bacterium]